MLLAHRGGAAVLVRELGAERAVALRADLTDDDEVRALVRDARTHFGSTVTTVAGEGFRGQFSGKCWTYVQMGHTVVGPPVRSPESVRR